MRPGPLYVNDLLPVLLFFTESFILNTSRKKEEHRHEMF